MNALQIAREIVASTENDLTKYAACNMWTVHAEQSLELGWWKKELARLEAQATR